MSAPSRIKVSTRAPVDFHCHLDLYPDMPGVIREAERRGVYTLGVTTTPRAWDRNQELMAGLKFVRPALGLHPQLVGERAAELRIWEQKLAETRYVGEVGLDRSTAHLGSFAEQCRVFRRIVQCCAEHGGKVLSVHSVRAASEVLDVLEEDFDFGAGKVVLHWFTGSQAEARRAVDLGCFFSVNPNMTRSQKGQVLLKALPRDRLLTETDGPFTESSGTPLLPWDAQGAVSGLASVLQLDEGQVREVVWRNLKVVLTS